MHRSLAAGVLLVIAAVGAPAHAGDDDVSIRPYDGPVWGGVPDAHVLFLVRDAATRRPIPGAIVRRHVEMEMGDDAVWGPARGEWRTDEHGLFALDSAKTEDGDAVSHWAIEAPGYAVTEAYGAGGEQEEIDLEPPRDVHGVLLDALGRPARGVLVEWKVGCAHAPALRVARTDADGRFVLRGVGSEGDVCYDGPGILADYAPPTAVGPVHLPPPVTVAEAALTLRGRIVNAPPGVLDRAVVRGMTSSRGPLARVARDGTFVLEGVGEGDELWLDAMGKERYAALDTGDFRPGGPLTWDLAATAGAHVPTVPVAVRERYAAGKPDDLEVPLRIAFDAADGGRRTVLDLSEDADVLDATVDLPPGSYDVSVAGDDRLAAAFRRFRTPPQRLDVRAAPAAMPAITIELVAQPRLEVVFSTPPDDDELLLHVDVPGAGHVFRRGDVVFLPADVDAVVRVAGHLRSARVGPVTDGFRRVVVDPRPTAVVRLLGLGADDTLEVQGHYGIEATEPARAGGAATLPWTGRPGPLRLRVFFEAGDSAETTLTVPEGPGAVLDVDVAALPRRVRGRIELDGPAAGAEALTLAAFDDEGNEVHVDVPVGARHAEHPAFTPGRGVRATRDRGVDAVWRLAGTSPFRLRLPSATLRLRFRAVDDVPPWPNVSVEGAGTRFEPEPERWERDDDGKDMPRGDAVVTISGLAAGVTTAYVARLPGSRAVEVRVPLRDGETREVIVPSFPR